MTLSKIRNRTILSCLPVALAGLALSGCAGDAFVSSSATTTEPQPDADAGAGAIGTAPVSMAEAPLAAPGQAGGGSEVVVGEAAGGASSGTGGVNNVAGAGGEPTQPVKLDLIDDLEGAFPQLPERGGRDGAWYMVHDDSGGAASFGAVPLLNPELGVQDQHAARLSGGGFFDWGAQLGVAMSSAATGYDASNYCGVRFLAKGTSGAWTLLISDRSSVPQGGVCGSWNGEPCYHFLGKSFEVGPDWQAIEIGFNDLSSRMDPDSTRKLDVDAVYDVLFNFYSPEGAAFELVVDDLAFIEKTGSDCPLSAP